MSSLADCNGELLCCNNCLGNTGNGGGFKPVGRQLTSNASLMYQRQRQLQQQQQKRQQASESQAGGPAYPMKACDICSCSCITDIYINPLTRPFDGFVEPIKNSSGRLVCPIDRQLGYTALTAYCDRSATLEVSPILCPSAIGPAGLATSGEQAIVCPLVAAGMALESGFRASASRATRAAAETPPSDSSRRRANLRRVHSSAITSPRAHSVAVTATPATAVPAAKQSDRQQLTVSEDLASKQNRPPRAKIKQNKTFEQDDKATMRWSLATVGAGHGGAEQDTAAPPPPPPRANRNDIVYQYHGESSLCDKLQQSTECLAKLLYIGLEGLFPVLGALKSYSPRRDLLVDLLSGITIAVLQIPQGMAYGMLAGVEPNFGLYVSFVPVLILALMSNSRHISYGTFAVVSMLLADTCNSVRDKLKAEHREDLLALDRQQIAVYSGASSSPLGHQQVDLSSLTDEPLLDKISVTTPLLAAASAFTMPSNIEILTCICIIVGLIQLLMSFGRLGGLTLMFSDQLVSSFTVASAIHVITSQLGALVDIELQPTSEGPFKVIRTWLVFGAELAKYNFNQPTACLSIISIVFLFVMKELIEPRLKRRFQSLTCIPSELMLMVAVLLCSNIWQFQEQFDVNIIGIIPIGLPEPQMPRLDLAPLLLKDSLVVALVSFSINLSLARLYARRFHYKINSNQELFALGSANLVSSFFHCFPCSSSLSRSVVQSNMNPKSQLSSIFSCMVVFSIVYKFAPILHSLPKSTLSCIIVVALKGVLIQVGDLRKNWLLSKLDALVWAVTFVSVLAFGVAYGLLLGIITSLLIVFIRILMPNHIVLGRVPGTDYYVDREACLNCQELDGIKIIRFNSPLCYLNAAILKNRVKKSLFEMRTSVCRSLISGLFCCNSSSFKCQTIEDGSYPSEYKIRFLIIDCSALTYCDYAGALILIELIEELGDCKIQVYLAACSAKLVDMIQRLNSTKLIEESVFPHISDATNQALYLINIVHDQPDN